jgi:transketolase
MHTIKPLDEKMISEEAEATGAILVAEEHQIWGGLGAHIAQYVSKTSPVPMEFVAIQDVYAESGKPDDLLKKYGLKSDSIIEASRRLAKKRS